MFEARRKARERLKRLLEMTSARGCTEAEALAAAEKAAQLMQEHSLSEADIIMDEKSSASRQKGRSPKARLWPTIAYCTNTAVIIRQGFDDTNVSFIGREPGPAIAVYLRDVCERAVDRAVKDFKVGKFYRRRRGLASKRSAVNAFQNGMVTRLNDRLLELFHPVVSVDEQKAAQDALAERYPGYIDAPTPRRDTRHHQAAFDGWRAGGDVHLSHAVTGSDAPLKIGGAG